MRLQPAPGTGPAAPPSRLLRGSAGRRAPTAQGAERSRAESSAPGRAPRAYRASTPGAAQPPAVSSARLRARRAGQGARLGAGASGGKLLRGKSAARSLTPPPRVWPALALGALAGPGPQGLPAGPQGLAPKSGTLTRGTGWERLADLAPREDGRQTSIKLGPLDAGEGPRFTGGEGPDLFSIICFAYLLLALLRRGDARRVLRTQSAFSVAE